MFLLAQMLIFFNNKMIQPHLRVEKVNKFCLLAGDPGRVERISKHLKNSKKVSDNRGFIVYEGDYEGVKITVTCTGIGGASAAIVAEELINAGAKYLIRIGSGSAFQKKINTGDAIISTGVLKNEGASKAYAPKSYPAIPDYDVLKALIESAKELKFTHYYGPTMCSDAFYAQSYKEAKEYWSNKGILGGEMEASMIFTISLLRGVKAGMIYHAGLNIKKKEEFKDIISQEKARLNGEKKNIMIALNAIKKLSMEVKN
ncbi:MAG: nucleoside phosphorylase [Candidatus Nanoarchaeia archaeon]|nr:nucleoside phosphorylase [Candidatus Nanoarchaeia archaeon]MDD5054322.1 nucleoside phosphorylase [Candidatus Nanoarchaeia archaeon]MDD5499342.1 nucleoside phosphorylase [Candidatus Nanoarchaeia archaeon]